MNCRILYFLFFIGLLYPASLFATTHGTTVYISSEKSVGLVESVNLIVIDEVGGGCWTNVKAVKNRLRYRLQAENISVNMADSSPISAKNPILTLSLVGFRSNRMCVVSYDLDLETASRSKYGLKNSDSQVIVSTVGSLWSESGVLISNETNKKILELVDSLADQLLADILSARKDEAVIEARKKFFDRYPSIHE